MTCILSNESSFCQVLQQLMSAVLATVLRQREAQCPVIRSIARELLTCLVMQPIMNLASPGYVEYFILHVIIHFWRGLVDHNKNWSFILTAFIYNSHL